MADRSIDRARTETQATMRTRIARAPSALALLGVLLAGCGSAGGYANAPRPPAPINVSISLTDRAVRVSPSHVGAGPVVLLVANEGSRSRDLILAARGGAQGDCLDASASSGPINPQGTARVPLKLLPGRCVITVRDAELRPASLTVGRERPSAQGDLLQP